MEYFISTVIIIVLIALIAYLAKVAKNNTGDDRKCLSCGYDGKMKTWMANYGLPQFITLVLLICYVIPGLIFIGWAWGKYKCPQCGALAKNTPAEISANDNNQFKKCPFCAEEIKLEAIKCKHCGSNL